MGRSWTIAFAVIALGASTARAECTESSLIKLSADLHPGRQFDSALVQCKAWPADPSLTIFVLPFPHPSAEGPDLTVFDVDVVVVNGETGTLIGRNYKPEAWTSDAMRISDVQIDTARYQLAGNSRAIGVRVTYTGSSGPNPYESQFLSLYLLRNKVLSQVLKQIVMSENRGEWDTNCSGEFEQFGRTLAVSTHKSNGLADILVSETGERRLAALSGTECKETRLPSPRKHYTLTFDGNSYSVPTQLRGWDP